MITPYTAETWATEVAAMPLETRPKPEIKETEEATKRPPTNAQRTPGA